MTDFPSMPRMLAAPSKDLDTPLLVTRRLAYFVRSCRRAPPKHGIQGASIFSLLVVLLAAKREAYGRTQAVWAFVIMAAVAAAARRGCSDCIA